jgi:hypothetical protein
MHSDYDELIPNRQWCDELKITLMQAWRNDRDPKMAALGWPLPIKRDGRKNSPTFRSRKQSEQYKANLVRLAHERREALFAAIARNAEQTAA